MIYFELNDAKGIGVGPLLKKLSFALSKEFKKSGRISVAFIGGEDMKSINKSYRKKNKTTDVLTFVMGEPGDSYLGEILLFRKDIEKRAKVSGKSLKETAAYLVIHGVCHIFGYTHKSEAGWKKMERKENKIMKTAGLC